MSLAEQINALEMDHAAAKAQIDALTAVNAALKSENKAIKAENEAMAISVDQMVRFTADTRAMVEKLSSDALEMLRQSRRETYAPPEVVRFAPKQTPRLMDKAKTAIEQEAAKLRPHELLEAEMLEFEARLEAERRMTLAERVDQLPGFNVNAAASVRPVREIDEARADAEALEVPTFLRRDQVFATSQARA